MKINKNIWSYFVLIFCLVGCQTVPVDYSSKQRIVDVEGSLARSLKLLHHEDSTNKAGFLLVNLTLELSSFSTMSLKSRVDWFDAEGNSMPSIDQNWNSFTIRSTERMNKSFIAPNASAQYYKITIREN